MYEKVQPLAQVLAQLVHFSVNDYYSPANEEIHYPEEVSWNVSFMCSCFLAQHTRFGSEGVETEFAQAHLAVGKLMPIEERVALAEAAVALLGGVK